MGELLALVPLLVLIVVCAVVVLVWLFEQLGMWLVRRYEHHEARRQVVSGSRDRSLRGKARIRARRETRS